MAKTSVSEGQRYVDKRAAAQLSQLSSSLPGAGSNLGATQSAQTYWQIRPLQVGRSRCLHGKRDSGRREGQLNARTTIAPPMPAEAVIATPEFCDSKQVKALFGLCRSHAYLLAQEGEIRSVCLRRPGATRGKRLVRLQSSIRALSEQERGSRGRSPKRSTLPDCTR